MPYNRLLYFRLPYFHVSKSVLFSTKYFSTLILYRGDLDTLYWYVTGNPHLTRQASVKIIATNCIFVYKGALKETIFSATCGPFR